MDWRTFKLFAMTDNTKNYQEIVFLNDTNDEIGMAAVRAFRQALEKDYNMDHSKRSRHYMEHLAKVTIQEFEEIRVGYEGEWNCLVSKGGQLGGFFNSWTNTIGFYLGPYSVYLSRTRCIIKKMNKRDFIPNVEC